MIGGALRVNILYVVHSELNAALYYSALLKILINTDVTFIIQEWQSVRHENECSVLMPTEVQIMKGRF